MKEADSTPDVADASEGSQEITRLLKAISAEMVRLVMLEARLFGHTALAMIGLTVMIALLVVGGWFFAGAALVMALASLKFISPAGALLTVALAHLALAALAFWRLRHITRDLTFRESRASVNGLLIHAQAAVDAAGVDASAPRPERTRPEHTRPEQTREDVSGSGDLRVDEARDHL